MVLPGAKRHSHFCSIASPLLSLSALFSLPSRPFPLWHSWKLQLINDCGLVRVFCFQSTPKVNIFPLPAPSLSSPGPSAVGGAEPSAPQAGGLFSPGVRGGRSLPSFWKTGGVTRLFHCGKWCFLPARGAVLSGKVPLVQYNDLGPPGTRNPQPQLPPCPREGICWLTIC